MTHEFRVREATPGPERGGDQKPPNWTMNLPLESVASGSCDDSQCHMSDELLEFLGGGVGAIQGGSERCESCLLVAAERLFPNMLLVV